MEETISIQQIRADDTIRIGYSGPMRVEHIEMNVVGDYNVWCHRKHPKQLVKYTIVATADVVRMK